jgi:hypothetical protein
VDVALQADEEGISSSPKKAKKENKRKVQEDGQTDEPKAKTKKSKESGEPTHTRIPSRRLSGASPVGADENLGVWVWVQRRQRRRVRQRRRRRHRTGCCRTRHSAPSTRSR